MNNFLIESATCQLVFLAIYYAFLQREKMYRFNRFYLLLSIVASFVIPFVNIEIMTEIPEEATTIQALKPIVSTISNENSFDVFPYLIWAIYGSVTLILSFNFVRNILQILRKMKASKPVKYKNANLILLDEETLPHTFLNTIFINKSDYENRDIEAELYEHELTHVTQKHTLDVLFIETLKTVFWFNPLIYFYKKAIQLNHEFLADEKVVESYSDVPFYQKLLLSKASTTHTYYLASNLNYSITKKRLIMMTKTTSQLKSMLYKIALIPILFVLISFLCIEMSAQIKPELLAQNTKEKPSDNDRDVYYAGVRFVVKKNDGSLVLDKKYEEMTLDEKQRFAIFVPKKTVKKSPTRQQLDDFKNSKKYAVWINDKNVPNSELDKYDTKDIAYFSGSSVFKNARTKKHPQPFQYWFFTHSYFDKSGMGKEPKKYSGDRIEIVLGKDNALAGKKEAEEVTGKQWSKVERILQNAAGDAIVNGSDPEFPGGIPAFIEFIAQNYQYPKDFKGEGKIVATFVIETDGRVNDVKIIKQPSEEAGQEAIRVLKKSPKWKPATKDGKTVRVEYTLPIQLKDK